MLLLGFRHVDTHDKIHWCLGIAMLVPRMRYVGA